MAAADREGKLRTSWCAATPRAESWGTGEREAAAARWWGTSLEDSRQCRAATQPQAFLTNRASAPAAALHASWRFHPDPHPRRPTLQQPYRQSQAHRRDHSRSRRRGRQPLHHWRRAATAAARPQMDRAHPAGRLPCPPVRHRFRQPARCGCEADVVDGSLGRCGAWSDASTSPGSPAEPKSGRGPACRGPGPAGGPWGHGARARPSHPAPRAPVHSGWPQAGPTRRVRTPAQWCFVPRATTA